jgi:hypothetical protein
MIPKESASSADIAAEIDHVQADAVRLQLLQRAEGIGSVAEGAIELGGYAADVAEDRLKEELYRLLDSLNGPVPLKIGEAFAVVIYCTAPHVDQKSRSKWARALRFAAANKPDEESIKKFIRRKGGINACASRYAKYVRRSDIE